MLPLLHCTHYPPGVADHTFRPVKDNTIDNAITDKQLHEKAAARGLTCMWPDTASSDTPDSIQFCCNSKQTCTHMECIFSAAFACNPHQAQLKHEEDAIDM